MEERDRTIYLLTLRGQTICESNKYVEFYDDKYDIKRIELENEEQLVEKALELLEKGKSVIIASDISSEKIRELLLKTDPRRQFTAFNTIKSHQ